MKNQNENTIRVFHLTQLNADELRVLNRFGWNGAGPRFTRYADITTGFKNLEAQVIEAWKLGEYHEAAVVETDSLDWAYHQTNNISGCWANNEDVTPKVELFKSTSVGDILIDANHDAWIVAPVGFNKVELPDAEPEINCGACTVAIGAHLMNEHCRETNRKPSHFFATSCFGFAMADSREAAIQKLVSRFRVDFKRLISSDRKTGGNAAYVWTCEVLQESYEYGIENFVPQDVEWQASREHTITRATLKTIEYTTKGA